MKRIFLIVCSLLLCFSAALWFGCKEQEVPGSIHGWITDKATGEPIKTAGVELQPSGVKTVTGTEGQYEFSEVDPGIYKLHITKTGYAELFSSEIIVKSGKATQSDVQIEKLPPSLRIVNDKQEDIDSLYFGAVQDDITRSFSIFNDGIESLQWEITKTAEWITQVSKENGDLRAGATQSIILTIDREKLNSGRNVTTIHITSNDGSKELKVIAIGETLILPTLNTLPATDIRMTSAIFHGELLTVGEPSYTERGFVYSLSSMPTVDNTINKLTVAVTTNKTFQATATDLTEGQTYYVRAYAINKAGTAYSTNEVKCLPTKALPTVQTDEITHKSIAEGRATLNATIIDAGEPAYTERGFVYGTNHNPMIDDAAVIKKVISGQGTGVYSVNLTNLEMGSLYYVRAYAINEIGTAYGKEVELDFHTVMPEVVTQSITNKSIGNGTARFNATITNQGDPAYTERGFVYGEQHMPTLEQNDKQIVSGSGIGDFSADVTGLEMGKYYYIRAYAKTENDISYGSELMLDFNMELPIVKTKAVTEIDATTATLNAEIQSLGDPAYTEAGFIYGTMPNPTLEEDGFIIKTVKGTGIGNYKQQIENLITGETYYARAYLRNEHYVAYGEITSFVPEVPPYVIIPEHNLMVQVQNLGQVPWSTADAMCKGSTVAGYTDWRLPTIEELMVLYNNKESIGGFSTSYTTNYWSSTPSGLGEHYLINFSTGEILWGYDSYQRNVRAVRTITE